MNLFGETKEFQGIATPQSLCEKYTFICDFWRFLFTLTFDICTQKVKKM